MKSSGLTASNPATVPIKVDTPALVISKAVINELQY